MHDLQLKINGEIHRGWQKIRIRQSIQQLADYFELTLTDRWQQNQQPRNIKKNDSCEIWIDDKKIITANLDKIKPTYNATTHKLVILGRSKAGDLVDCTLPGKTFIDRSLLQIAKELFKPFAISVSTTVDINKPFKKAVLKDGQSPFEFIESLARIRAVRMVSNADGDVVFTRTGADRITTPLKLGDNILNAAGEFTASDLFSEYVVSAQQNGSDTTFGAAAAHTTATVKSNHIQRHRPKLVLLDEPGDISDCKKHGEWQRNSDYGRSNGIVYTVQDWYHDDGLWQPNVLVPVDDAYAGIKEDRLIGSVDFILDETNGLGTEIEVFPKEAFDLIALPEPKVDEVWG